MAEALLINPRGRRRRRRTRKARGGGKRRRARARRNPFAVARRRRRGVRRVARRGSRRRARARRNPGMRIPFLGSVNVQQIGGTAGGFLATQYGTPFALSLLPPEWKAQVAAQPLFRIGAKAAVGLVILPMLAKMLFPRGGVAASIRLGAGVAIAVDLFNTYVAPSIPGLAMADYETQVLSGVGMYETATLSDSATAYGEGAYGGGTYNF